jgi:hypothetical protein
VDVEAEGELGATIFVIVKEVVNRTSLPTNNFLAIATPPAVVIVPPFVIFVASVVLLIDKPPINLTPPLVAEVADVADEKYTVPSVLNLN